MPSFLNKVFGYKKHDDKDASRPSREASGDTLLDGKYEAISPVVSPTAIAFAEAQSSKDADREVGFSLFRPKSRGVSQKPSQKRPEAIPQLTLHLPGPKENLDSRALGVAFEADPDTQLVLDDAVIGAKRLNPLEALILIRACAQAITERGLETLGIMHPHWFSASHEVQRRLISLFIHSLAPQSRITTLSPTPTASVTAFENELHYTRSPHDVAAVLRWGLRHLSLENGHFGKDAAEWSWYNAFFNAERDASYPVQGFSQLLLPQLPTPHIELLISTLTLISSLASHAEINSISGSKLSKFLGLWLLAATRSEQSDDWDHFYARWERAGRILEHLFLARLRDESLAQRLPTRLQELIKYYPYNKGSPATEEDLLSRPRFTTQQYDALFVRIETVLTHSAEQPRQHPIQLVIDALQLPTANLTGNEYIELWNALKTAASERDPGSADGEGPQFSRIFADETLQLLSLIPADSGAPTSPILLATPISKVVSPKRSSSSLTKILERAVSKARGSNGSAAVSPTSPATPKITDWAQFSMSGFGETPATQPLSALFDQDDDIEVTQPQISRKSSRKRGKSRTRRRRSEDNDLSATPSTQQLSETEPVIVETKLASVHVIQIDEAFIDFWSDAIVDPISADWPTFVVCGLKVIPSAEKPIRWLVIEQIYSREEPQPPPRIPSPEAGARGRSPRPSFRSDISGFRLSNMFSSTRKRFSVFSKSATDLTTRKSMGKSPKVGELGEILAEEEPATPSIPDAAEGSSRVAETILATAVVTNGTTSGGVQQSPECMATTSESFTAGGLPASADQTPTTVEPFEFKEPVIRAKAPSAEATPQNNHGDISANLDSIKLSEDVTSTEVISQTMSTPGDVVDGSLVIVGSPTAAETSAVLQETAGAQVSVETVAMVDGIGIERAVAEEGVPEPAVEEAQVLVQGNQQPDFVEPVEIPSVAVAEETAVPESVVLTEEISVSTAVETSESALLAAEPEPAAEPVVEESHVSVEVEEPWRESVAVAEPEPEALEIPAAQEEAGETDAQQSLDVSEIVEASREVAQEIEIATPAPETVTLVDETPSQETDANEPEPAPEPEQFEEQLSEAVVGESQVVIVAEPSLDGVSQPAEEPSVEAVPAVAVEPETVANETVEVQASVEAESSQEAVVEEPPVEAVPVVDASEPAEVAPVVVAEPEPVLDEVPEPVAEEVQVLVEDEASQDAVAQPAEEPSAPELEAVDDAPAAAALAAEEVVEAAVVADVEGQPEPETSVPEPTALVEETSGPEVVVEESEPAEVAPAVAAELEPPAEEATPEPLVEEVAPEPVVESPAPVEPKEPVPAEVPSTEPVPEVVAEDVVAAEEVEEPVLEVPVEVVEDAAPEAIEEVAAPEPAIDVVEPIVAEPESIVEETAPAVPEEAAAPEIVVEASEAPVEEEQTPVEAEEAVSPEVTVEASEPAVATEPESSKDMAPESTAEEVATQDAPAAELVIEASEPLVTAEPELSEEKGSEPLVEEQTPVETVEPSVESVPPVEASGQATSAPAAEQHLAAEVVAVEPAAEPEPEVVSPEPEAAVEEPQQVAEEPEPTPSVEETTVVVEEDAAPETAPEIIEPAPAAPEPEPSEEQAPEPVVEEVEVTVEAQESSDSAPEVVSVEVALQEPESAVVPEDVPMEEPVEVAEEPAVELVSEQVDAQPEAVPSEPEAAPLVEDEVEPKPIVEEPFAEDAAAVDETTPTPEAVEQTDAPQEAAADIPAEPSMPEVDVPTQEPPAPSGDAAAEDA